MIAISNQPTSYDKNKSSVSLHSDPICRKKKAQLLDLESTKSQFLPEEYVPLNPRPSALGVPPALIFRPTKEEFSDPHKYIKNIAPLARKCGIAKIIPPPGWDPGFHLDTEVNLRSSNMYIFLTCNF